MCVGFVGGVAGLAANPMTGPELTEAERDAVMDPWWQAARAEGWDVDADTIYWAAVDGLAWSLIEQTMDTSDRQPSAETFAEARATAERILAARVSTATGDTDLRDRVTALLADGPDTWEGYDSRDVGHVFHADSVLDFTADLRAALTDTDPR